MARSAAAVEVVRFERRREPLRLTPDAAEVSTPVMPTEGRTLRQEVDLDAPPQTVFDALMDQQHHAAFTGCEAQIDWREGGRFTTCDERQFGYTLVLVPGRRIVQAWSHQAFPPHHYTVVTLELEARGAGTRLQLTQTNVPADAIGWLDEAWRTECWEPLKRYVVEMEAEG